MTKQVIIDFYEIIGIGAGFEMDEMTDKREIRKRVMALRNAIPVETIAAKSSEIVRRLKELREIRESSSLMVFLNFGSEVLTDGLIEWGWDAGKRIVVPLCHPESREMTPCRIDGFDDLEAGHYGIREPKADRLRVVPPGEIDAVLVPAVAFDRRGYRVGYGGGYYDRFLPKVPRAVTIGAVFACQIVPEVPRDRFDVQVERIVTEEGIITPEDERRLPA
jgi:5-formyltetrahydrofolate cyclo-ligase